MKLLVPPPVQGLLIAGGMWWMAQATPALAFTMPGQKLAALLIAGAGLSIDLTSIIAFVRAKTTILPMQPEKATRLVVGGLYRISRNPMYLGMLMVLIGIALWLGNPLNIALIGLFVALITELQIKPEEARLAEVFGDEYAAYKTRVRRWI